MEHRILVNAIACVSPGAGFDLRSGLTLDPDSRRYHAGKPKLAANEGHLCPGLGRVRWAPRQEDRRDAYDTIGVMPP